MLYELSYSNLILYSASLPTYSTDEIKGKDKDKDKEVINADDPKNAKEVEKFLNSIQ